LVARHVWRDAGTRLALTAGVRKIGVLIALCVAGCQFSVNGLGGDVSSGPQQQQPAVDFASAPIAVDASTPADLTPADDLSKPPPPPPPGPGDPQDCRFSGCGPKQVCIFLDGVFQCHDKVD
jgi:hypothetical protein